MMAEDDDRDEEQHHDREEHREVLELAPDDDRPFRVHDVMDDDPEETAGQHREIKGEGEKPGETELFRIYERAHHAQTETDDSHQRQQERERREPVRLDVFAFRSGHDVGSFAHFLAGSGLGSGFVSAGLSISARCSGGTSASLAFWLRCNARRYEMIAQRSVTLTFGP